MRPLRRGLFINSFQQVKQDSALAIAVAKAGGLGSLPCAMFSEAKVREEIEKIRSETQRCFNVNFFCHEPAQVNREIETGWLKILSPYYDEFGLNQSEVSSGPARLPMPCRVAHESWQTAAG